jgi:hypothetical protein
MSYPGRHYLHIQRCENLKSHRKIYIHNEYYCRMSWNLKTLPYYKIAKKDALDGGKCFHNLHIPIFFACTLDTWHIQPGNISFVDSRMYVAECLSVSCAGGSVLDGLPPQKGVYFMTHFSKKSMYHLVAKF